VAPSWSCGSYWSLLQTSRECTLRNYTVSDKSASACILRRVGRSDLFSRRALCCCARGAVRPAHARVNFVCCEPQRPLQGVSSHRPVDRREHVAAAVSAFWPRLLLPPRAASRVELRKAPGLHHLCAEQCHNNDNGNTSHIGTRNGGANQTRPHPICLGCKI
jgi:hypothetical protein